MVEIGARSPNKQEVTRNPDTGSVLATTRTTFRVAVGVSLTLGLQRLSQSAGLPADSGKALEGFAALPALLALLWSARQVAIEGMVRAAPRHGVPSRRLTAWLVGVATMVLPAFAPGAPWAAVGGGAVLAAAMVVGSRVLEMRPDADLSFEAAQSNQRVWWAGGASVLTLGLVMVPVLAANPPTDAVDPARLAALWLAGLVAVTELPAWYGRLTGRSSGAQRIVETVLWATFAILILSVYRTEVIVFTLLAATPIVVLLLELFRRHRRASSDADG